MDWHRLGLIIVDEQHRFGVAQRQALMKKLAHAARFELNCHADSAVLGPNFVWELDLSLLKTKPAGRQTIITELVSPNSTQSCTTRCCSKLMPAAKRMVLSAYYRFYAAPGRIGRGRLQTAEGPLKSARIGLLHGKLKAVDKQAVMADFVAGKLDVLVSTTVIEVGVDVPNATTMVIMSRSDLAGAAPSAAWQSRTGNSAKLLLPTIERFQSAQQKITRP